MGFRKIELFALFLQISNLRSSNPATLPKWPRKTRILLPAPLIPGPLGFLHRFARHILPPQKSRDTLAQSKIDYEKKGIFSRYQAEKPRISSLFRLAQETLSVTS